MRGSSRTAVALSYAGVTFLRMAVPEIIPIGYEPDHRTDTIGHWDGGQFLSLYRWGHVGVCVDEQASSAR